jgi:hypothetical protein
MATNKYELDIANSFARRIWSLTQCARHLFAFCRSLELALGLQLGVCHSEPAPPQTSKRQAPGSSPIFSKIEFSVGTSSRFISSH